MEILTGGLIAIGTLIITKVFDLIQKSKEHKYSLKKAFFEKKLQAAEAAICQWEITASTMANFIEVHHYELSEDMPYEVYKIANDILSSQFQKMEEASNALSNSISLYFDLDESTFLEKSSLKRLLSSYSSYQRLSNQKDFLLELQKKLQGTTFEDYPQTYISEIDKQIDEAAKDFLAVIREAEKDFRSLIKRIRQEMKQYDS